MDLSVVVPVLDVGDVLADQLDALVRQEYDGAWELVLADNGSTDRRTIEIMDAYARLHPRVRIIDASRRRGRSAALNVGVEAARCDRLAFCDGDDVVAEGWVQHMAEAVSDHRLVAGPLDYHRLNKPWVVTARGCGSDQLDGPLYIDGGPPWPFAGGGNLAVHRKWHDEVGGFDESIVYGGEDCDYSWKLAVKGVRVHWAPDAVVHYRLRSTLRDIYRQARAYAIPHVTLQGRWGDVWPVPPVIPSRWRLLRQGLRLAPALRSRAGVGFWVWSMGWSVGSRVGATLPPQDPLPVEFFAPDAAIRAVHA